MTTTNYFKVHSVAIDEETGRYGTVDVGTVFFDDRTKSATETAFVQACKLASAAESPVVSVWRLPPHFGPWDGVELVGHRNCKSIADDLEIVAKQLSESTLDPYARDMLNIEYQARIEEMDARARAANGRMADEAA